MAAACDGRLVSPPDAFDLPGLERAERGRQASGGSTVVPRYRDIDHTQGDRHDHLRMAEAVLGPPAEAIANFNRIGLAASALAAPKAGFGGV